MLEYLWLQRMALDQQETPDYNPEGQKITTTVTETFDELLMAAVLYCYWESINSLCISVPQSRGLCLWDF